LIFQYQKGKINKIKTFVKKDRDYKLIANEYLPKVLEEFGLTKLPQF